jgi:hypothetical protein
MPSRFEANSRTAPNHDDGPARQLGIAHGFLRTLANVVVKQGIPCPGVTGACHTDVSVLLLFGSLKNLIAGYASASIA